MLPPLRNNQLLLPVDSTDAFLLGFATHERIRLLLVRILSMRNARARVCLLRYRGRVLHYYHFKGLVVKHA